MPIADTEDRDLRIATLQANANRLVDEKHALAGEIERLTEANERLTMAIAEATAERDALKAHLAAKEGLGIQENRPDMGHKTIRDELAEGIDAMDAQQAKAKRK
jgi:hypothetical protein